MGDDGAADLWADVAFWARRLRCADAAAFELAGDGVYGAGAHGFHFSLHGAVAVLTISGEMRRLVTK